MKVDPHFGEEGGPAIPAAAHLFNEVHQNFTVGPPVALWTGVTVDVRSLAELEKFETTHSAKV